VAIGPVGEVTTEQARRRAALAIDRIKQGLDPDPPPPAPAAADGSVFRTAVPARRLLLLTGCRKNEILNLQWDDVDRVAEELRLRDSKSGWRSVPLTPAVVHVLAGIPRRADNPWVITGQKRGEHLQSLDDIWQRLRRRAELEDVRIHNCRHHVLGDIGVTRSRPGRSRSARASR